MPYVIKATGQKPKAVTTLEEAQQAFSAALSDHCREHGCYRFPESGGTVGPLPDGSTIQVEPGPGQRDMRQDLRVWGVQIDTLRATDEEVSAQWVAAFNARHA